MAGDVAHRAFGRGDLDLHDGFEHDGPGLQHRVDESLAARGGEGDVLAVH
jgi:hypothetical protein